MADDVCAPDVDARLTAGSTIRDLLLGLGGTRAVTFNLGVALGLELGFAAGLLRDALAVVEFFSPPVESTAAMSRS